MRDLGTVTLETERLILRKFTPSDAEGMYTGWASDEKVTRYLSWNACGRGEASQHESCQRQSHGKSRNDKGCRTKGAPLLPGK